MGMKGSPPLLFSSESIIVDTFVSLSACDAMTTYQRDFFASPVLNRLLKLCAEMCHLTSSILHGDNVRSDEQLVFQMTPELDQ